MSRKTLNPVMDLVTKVTNLSRRGYRYLIPGKFTVFFGRQSLMDVLEEVFGAFLFVLRSEIPMSLEDKVCDDMTAYCRSKEMVCLCDISFLTDISSRLNNLNAKLQGKSRET